MTRIIEFTVESSIWGKMPPNGRESVLEVINDSRGYPWMVITYDWTRR